MYICSMKIASYKPQRTTDGYVMKKQLHGGFKILEYYHYELHGKATTDTRKRTIKKNMLLTDAENLLYRLEHKV